MAKRKKQLDELKQLTEFMREHNIRKLKTLEFQIEMGRPEDDVDLEKIKAIDERTRLYLEKLGETLITSRSFPLPEESVAGLSPEDRAKSAGLSVPILPDVKNDSRRNQKERSRKVQ